MEVENQLRWSTKQRWSTKLRGELAVSFSDQLIYIILFPKQSWTVWYSKLVDVQSWFVSILMIHTKLQISMFFPMFCCNMVNLRFKPAYLVDNRFGWGFMWISRGSHPTWPAKSVDGKHGRQEDELRMLDVADMGAQVRKRQMEWFHCPIPDRDGWIARFGLIF